jgi:tetratricopeptide (TPR) repeat protein
MELKDYQGAYDDHSSYFELTGDRDIYYDLGYVSYELNQFEDAYEYFYIYEKMKLDSTEAGVYYQLGYICLKMSMEKEAISHFDKYLAKEPKDAEAYYYRGLAYYEIDDKKYALKNMRKSAIYGDKDAKIFLKKYLN